MVDLSCLGAHSATRTFIAGKVRPPPRPMRILMRMRYWNPAAEQIGLRRVAPTLRTTATKKTHLPP